MSVGFTTMQARMTGGASARRQPGRSPARPTSPAPPAQPGFGGELVSRQMAVTGAAASAVTAKTGRSGPAASPPRLGGQAAGGQQQQRSTAPTGAAAVQARLNALQATMRSLKAKGADGRM